MIITEDKVPAVDWIYYWVGENGEYDFIYTKLNEHFYWLKFEKKEVFMMKSWLTEYQIIELKIKKADLINKMALCIKKIRFVFYR